MVRLERSVGTAISAAVSERLQERDPLFGGVTAFRGKLAASPSRTDRLPKFSVGADVGREVRRKTLLMSGVVIATFGVVLVRMLLPPPSHRLAGILRIPAHPLAAVLPPSFWIAIWHRS